MKIAFSIRTSILIISTIMILVGFLTVPIHSQAQSEDQAPPTDQNSQTPTDQNSTGQSQQDTPPAAAPAPEQAMPQLQQQP